MPPSALISVHTVGCAWRLLMCYVNTLPKRPGREAFLRTVPTGEPISRRPRSSRASRSRHREWVDRGKLMRLPTGRYRTPLSRASPAENVSRLGEKSRNLSVEAAAELGIRSIRTASFPATRTNAVFSAVRKMCAARDSEGATDACTRTANRTAQINGSRKYSCAVNHPPDWCRRALESDRFTRSLSRDSSVFRRLLFVLSRIAMGIIISVATGRLRGE